MSLMFEDNYEPISTTEADDMLADLPFDLIKASIEEQIEDPMSNNTNYIQHIIDKCDVCKDVFENNEDAIATIDNALHEFFVDIIKAIDERFGMSIDLNEIAGSHDLNEIAVVLYEFFILRYRKNIYKYIKHYIKRHKESLVDYYSGKSTRDVTTLSNKNVVKDPDDLVIIANLPSIINYIVGLDITTFDFVDLCAGKSNYNARVIKGLIAANQIIGNFVTPYISVSLDEHDYLIDEILTDIRVSIANK